MLAEIIQNSLLGLENPDPMAKRYVGEPWTVEEDGLVARLSPAEAAERTGRSLGAVYQRRAALRAWLGR